MNTIIRTAMLVVAIVMTSATIALAETIYYLKIEKNGVLVKTVSVASDGSFTIGVLPEGAYTISVVDAQGQNLDVTGSLDILISPPANARGTRPNGERAAALSHVQTLKGQPIKLVVELGGGTVTGRGTINTSKSNIKNSPLTPTTPK